MTQPVARQPAHDERTPQPVDAAPSARPQKATTAPAPTQVDQLVAGASAPSAGTTTASTPSTSGLAVAPVLDLGDRLIGSRSTSPLHVFNLDPRLGAVLDVQLVGHPSIQLATAPTHLRPSREGYAANPVQITFAPTSDHVVASTAIITARWQMDERPVEEVRVSILGVAHAPSHPSHAERVARDEADRAQAAAARSDAVAAAALKARIERQDQQRVHRYGDGARRRLEREVYLFRAAMLDLSNKRLIGVTEASSNIGEFKRTKPVVEQPSLIERLAFAALDAATGGIAKVISEGIRGTVETWLTSSSIAVNRDPPSLANMFDGKSKPVVRGPSKQVMNLVIEGAKGLVKKGGSTLVDQAMNRNMANNAHHTAGDSSIDAKAAFIATQTDAFLGDSNTRAELAASDLYDGLLSTLEVNADAAVEEAQEATARVTRAKHSARQAQQEATMVNWIRYLAQSSMGSLDEQAARSRGLEPAADGAGLTNLAPATHAPNEHRPMRSFDGLVDLRFMIDEIDPGKPAKFVSAKLHGVRGKLATLLQTKPDLLRNVPIRASADASAMAGVGQSRSAVTPLSVTRDEAGNVAHVDQMGLPWEQPRWLSRKAGATKGSPAAQKEGARKLLEELMTDMQVNPATSVKSDEEP